MIRSDAIKQIVELRNQSKGLLAEAENLERRLKVTSDDYGLSFNFDWTPYIKLNIDKGDQIVTALFVLVDEKVHCINVYDAKTYCHVNVVDFVDEIYNRTAYLNDWLSHNCKGE